VSRKVGYRPNGRQWVNQRGAAAEQERVLLTPETFVRDAPVRVTGVAQLRAFPGMT